jgi:hypothetical protein
VETLYGPVANGLEGEEALRRVAVSVLRNGEGEIGTWVLGGDGFTSSRLRCIRLTG